MECGKKKRLLLVDAREGRRIDAYSFLLTLMLFDDNDDDDKTTPPKPDEGGPAAGQYDSEGVDVPGSDALDNSQL